MNARDFFSESDFEQILNIYKNEIVVDILDSPFEKKIKTNGNSYSLLIYSDHYISSVYNGAFFLTCSYDFNHKGPYQSREIYGGFVKPDMTSFESFLNSLNVVLKRTPDYKDDEEELQLRFF